MTNNGDGVRGKRMSDQAFEVLRARVDRMRSSGSASAALEPVALADALRLADTIAVGESRFEARLALGWFYWYRHLAFRQARTKARFRPQ
jgi:hypothetical protein